MVLDASAVLAFLQGEDGADQVAGALAAGALTGAANWAEVAQKVVARGNDWSLSRGVLESFGLLVEPVTQADAERAAVRWPSDRHLSLGDRLCLALADRLDVEVLTADRAWGSDAPVRQIR
jgi:PIN domain nuclease of toxin-antitoxin system